MGRLSRAALLGLTVLCVTAAPASAATFTVDSTADTNLTACTAAAGDCTLRGAINDANGAAGADTVGFDISAVGVQTIGLTASLPDITGPVTIDGYSQSTAVQNTSASAWNGTLTIAIDANEFKGLVVTGGGSTIKGLAIYDTKGPAVPIPDTAINSFIGDAILLKTTGGNKVEGNFLGTMADGSLPSNFPDDERNRSSGVRVLSGDNNTIGGSTPQQRNLLSGNGDFQGSEGENGVRVSGGSGTVVAGNLIGTDKTGTSAVPNARGGVFVNGVYTGIGAGVPEAPIANTTIGGTAAGDRNLISGNGDSAVEVLSSGGSTKILGNRIGTDVTGTSALGNAASGAIRTNDDPVQIGDDAGHGNLISGNGGYGLYLFGNGHTIQGNLIGTNAAGTAALGNANAGIQLRGNDMTIGGSTAQARNVISGNNGQGIGSDDVAGNDILGNYIGTNSAGTAAVGNGGGGIVMSGGLNTSIDGNVVSANGGPGVSLVPPEGTTNDSNEVIRNKIGTDAAGSAALGNAKTGVLVYNGFANVIGRPGQGNVIANNAGDGVVIDGPEDAIRLGALRNDRNSIRGNSIFANGELGIDLGPNDVDSDETGDLIPHNGDGVTPNDAGDGDAGNNELQNFPLVNAALPGSSTFVRGFIGSRPQTTYTIDLYRTAPCDASGNGEGAKWLGSTTTTTNGSGRALWSTTVAETVPLGEFVTATATDPDGNTSEFSACRESGTQVADQAIEDPVEQHPQEQTPQQQTPPQQQAPVPQLPQVNPCTDKKPPITSLKKGGVKFDRRAGKLALRGTSADHKDCPSGLARVDVSLARVKGRTGTNCRFIKKPNRYSLTKPQNCRRPVLFKATGTDAWNYTFPVKLKPGLYRVQARATDKAKNKETPKKKLNIVFFEVK